MMKIFLTQWRWVGIFLAVLTLMLDQVSKSFIVTSAQSGALPFVVLPFFRIVLVHNTGISFGLLTRVPPHASHWMPLLITIATSLIVCMLAVWLWRAREKHVILSLGFIIGGAAGNILDRARTGAVVDFLDFFIGNYHWPAFNIADSAIFIGVVILVLMGIVSPQPKGIA